METNMEVVEELQKENRFRQLENGDIVFSSKDGKRIVISKEAFNDLRNWPFNEKDRKEILKDMIDNNCYIWTEIGGSWINDIKVINGTI